MFLAKHDTTILENTQSYCPYCKSVIPAQIVSHNNSAYIVKQCPSHGEQWELREADVAYFIKRKEYDKPGTDSIRQTETKLGCPWDCGLCPTHRQHTCIGLIEVTTACNLGCSDCYAHSQDAAHHLSLAQIESMMDFYQKAENGQAEILQISGGEPTLHPQIIEIINMAKAKNFKYVMLNTNGLRIAVDTNFAEQLHNFGYGFEVYLQFDGFTKKTSLRLRGQDLTAIKKQAVANLVNYEVPMTLVSSMEFGINEHELGALILYGLRTKYIRGINIQPLAYWGESEAAKQDQRLTISGITKLIEEQTAAMIRQNDFIPLPCNVERVALTYLLKNGVEFIPITRNTDIKKYLSLINNTFAFKVQDVLGEASKGLLNLNIACECFNFFKDFRNVIPKGFDLYKKDAIEDTFRISITSFVDAFNFDLQSAQKECVHVITPDLKRIPFSAYNAFHRRR